MKAPCRRRRRPRRRRQSRAKIRHPRRPRCRSGGPLFCSSRAKSPPASGRFQSKAAFNKCESRFSIRYRIAMRILNFPRCPHTRIKFLISKSTNFTITLINSHSSLLGTGRSHPLSHYSSFAPPQHPLFQVPSSPMFPST